MVEEEDIDTEALQAQIDLSMSVTNDLVSSWLKPSNKPKILYSQTLEAELKDYMRKPPRLGVGASIPESTSISSRESARLKGNLVGKGKKRAREDEGDSSNRPTSDDEGESRSGAIRKKPVPNPFTMPTKKKKLSQNEGTMDPISGASGSGKVGGDTKDLASLKGTTSESDISRNKERKQADKNEDSCPTVISTKTGEQKDHSTKLQTLPRQMKQTLTSPSTLPSQNKPHRHNLLSSHDSQPILNLNGPVGDLEDNSQSDKGETSSVKHKKKRRKRKKKKRAQVTGAGPSGSVELSRPTS